MNLRQKAKHFKWLYEQTLARTPVKLVYQAVDLQHIRCAQSLSYNLASPYEIEIVREELLRNATVELSRHIKCENTEIGYYPNRRLTLDFWVEERREE